MWSASAPSKPWLVGVVVMLASGFASAKDGARDTAPGARVRFYRQLLAHPRAASQSEAPISRKVGLAKIAEWRDAFEAEKSALTDELNTARAELKKPERQRTEKDPRFFARFGLLRRANNPVTIE